MIETQEPSVGADRASDRLCVLARDFQTRIVNCSATGCLIETTARIEVGTIGTLRFVLDGRELVDEVQVVRCQPIEGAGSQFQVGARFLRTTLAAGRDSVRRVLGSVSA